MSSANLTATLNVEDRASAVLKQFSAEIQRTNAAATKGATAGGSFGAAWGKAALAIGAVTVGAVALTRVVTDAAQAAAAEEAELTKLNRTLGNLGFAAASAQVNTFVDDLQFAAGVADTDLRNSFQTLLRATGDVTEAQEALALAVDVSAGTGRELSAVSLALAKGYAGQTAGLGRLGAGLDKTTLATGDMALITEKMSDIFGGQAAANTQTLSGRLRVLGLAADELKESFGTGLLSTLVGDGTDIDATTRRLRDLQGAAEDLGATLGTVLSGAATGLGTFVKVVQSVALETAYRMEAVSLALQLAYTNVADFFNEISDEEGAYQRRQIESAQAANDAAYAQGILALHVGEAGDAAAAATGPTGLLADAEEDAGDAAEEAAPKITALASAMGLLDNTASRQQALASYKQSLADFVSKPSKDAAYEVIDNFNQAYDAFRDGGKRQAEFVVDNYDEMVKTIKSSGLSESAQGELIRPLRDARTEAQRLLDTLNLLNGKQVSATVVLSQLGAAAPYVIKPASGGYITGPGTGTSDSIPAMVSNGEYVIRAAAVKAIGVDTLHRINAQGYARGGPVRGRTPVFVNNAGMGSAGVGGVYDFIRQLIPTTDTAREETRRYEELLRDQERAAQERERAAQEAAREQMRLMEELHRQQQAIISAARATLESAQSTRDDFARSVASGAIGYGSITGFDPGGDDWAALSRRAPGSEGAGSAASSPGSISGYMATRLARVQRFGDVVKRLAGAGLNLSTLREVIGAGPDQGTTLGEALLESGVTEISRVNSIQTQLEDLSGGIGAFAGNTIMGGAVTDAYGNYTGVVMANGGVDQTPLQVNLLLDGQTVVTQLLAIKRARGGVALGLG